METVLIADDEVNIREGLKIIIDWNELGFEICGEAANGEEALSAILEKNPSLVLLDIRMPKMYGTDLIRIARERGYKGRFINFKRLFRFYICPDRHTLRRGLLYHQAH